MELPKNITQIGEADQHCKVYVEDYVVSYIKQMNRLAENRNMAIALYGIRKEENGVSYIFFYGAGKINSIQKEIRHLSQAQNQEIDKIRKRFFSNYQFIGYRMLDGEMVEGFHICEQGVCRYIKGYACFYEKNDAMLAYMLESRKEEAPPETVDQEKFERVKRRQEERKAQYLGSLDRQSERRADKASDEIEEEMQLAEYGPTEKSERAQKAGQAARTGAAVRRKRADRTNASVKQKQGSKGTFGMMKVAVAAVFLLLCVLGIAGMNDFRGLESIQTAGRNLIAEFTEQKIPDSQSLETAGQNNTLVTEDKLTDAIQQENALQGQKEEAAQQEETQQGQIQQGEITQQEEQAQAQQNTQDNIPESTQQEIQGQEKKDESEETAENTAENTEDANATASQVIEESQEPSQQASAPVAYTIKKGDTLTAISIRTYGTDAKVKEICELNGIDDPDDIRFGQKILLP